MPQEASKTSKVRTGHVFTEEQINSLTETLSRIILFLFTNY